MAWFDVSIPLKNGVTVWPGDQEFEFKPAGRIAKGDTCNTSSISMSTHTGTHCDAPWHFEEEGKKLDEVNPEVYFGTALLIDLSWVDRIEASHLPREPLPPRVLFKTRNSRFASDGPFNEQFVALDVSAAERLVEDGVRMVGIDAPSIAPFGNSAPTHHVLLDRNVFVVEGLRLDGFNEGVYEFIVLPMPLDGADGAPCRAFMRIPIPEPAEDRTAGVTS